MYKQWVNRKLRSAGLTINNDQADPQYNLSVFDEKFYTYTALKGSLGFGESYADGKWDCTNLDKVIFQILQHRIDTNGLAHIGLVLRSAACNMQNKIRAMRVARQHYNVDTDVFDWMLDPYLQYTCGYWAEAESLNEAQTAKMDLVIKKLGLSAGDSVLDIGCGWGGFAKYAAETHGIKMFGLSISSKQLEYAKKLCAGLDCTFKFGDYRHLPEIYPQTFDAITIIGVTEHIGYKNYKGLYKVMRDRLKPGGLVLQHTITHMKSCQYTDPFVERYIFPGGMVPSVEQLSTAMKSFFVLEDLHNFSADYDKTLCAWHENFKQARENIEQAGHLGKRFYRIWEYYLLSCAAMFRARQAQLMQLVLSPDGVAGGYRRVS